MCVGLVFWSRDCCSPCRHLTHGHLAFSFKGRVSPRLGEGEDEEEEEEEEVVEEEEEEEGLVLMNIVLLLTRKRSWIIN